MSTTKTIKWGIIGTGWIANYFAKMFPRSDNCELLAVASKTPQHAREFADKYRIPRVYTSDEELAADPDIDAVYIATPTSAHVPNILACLGQGKHVLCEKTITMNVEQLDRCIAEAERNNVILAEGLTSIYEDVYPFMKKKIASDEYGKVQFVTVTCGSDKPYDATNRYFAPALGGGAIFDIGCYAIGFANYFMSSYPTTVRSEGLICDTGVDVKSAFVLRNKENELATVLIGLRGKTEKIGIISCENAFVRIEQFIRGHKATVTFPNGRTEVYDFPVTDLDAEVKALNSDIRAGQSTCSACPIELSRSIISVMDTAREQWGYRFAFEEEKHD